MNRTQTRSQTRAVPAPPDNAPSPAHDEQARRSPKRHRKKKRSPPHIEEGSGQSTNPMPGGFAASETTGTAATNELPARLETSQELVERTLSPLTEQGETTLPQDEPAPAPEMVQTAGDRAGSPPAAITSLIPRSGVNIPTFYGRPESNHRSPPWQSTPVPDEGREASTIRRITLLDPAELARNIDDLMRDQSIAWSLYENPPGFDNHGVSHGRHQADKINRMRDALNEMLDEASRATTLEYGSPIKPEPVESTDRPTSRSTDYNDLYVDPAPAGGERVETYQRDSEVPRGTPHVQTPRREFLADVPGRPEYLNRDPDAIMRHIAQQRDAEYGGADNKARIGTAGTPGNERRERDIPRPPPPREPPHRHHAGPRNGAPAAGGAPGGPPPPGPPGNDGSDTGSSDEDPSESVLNSEQNYVHQQLQAQQRANRQYLRGYTPGNARYMDAMQDRYVRRIREMVGDPLGQVGPELKAMNPPKPSKYDGQDDLEKFDDWLSQLLKYFRTFKVAGPDREADRVLYTGLYLEGIAAQWYDQEIESPDRRVRHWDFESLITELFKRFVHEASAQHAADQFDRTRYDPEKGVLAFYNDLKRRAHQMVESPDDYSFRRKFLRGLPHSIIKAIYEARGISAEHSTIEEVLDEVRRMETAQKAIAQHLRTGQGSGGRTPQKGTSSQASKETNEENSRGRRGRTRFFKKGNTLYRRQDRSSRVNEGSNTSHQRDTRENESAKDNSSRKFLPGITCYKCKGEGHMAHDCPHHSQGKPESGTTKRRLFAVEVQDGPHEQDEARQGEPCVGCNPDSANGDGLHPSDGAESSSKDRDAAEDSLFDSFEEVSNVGDDDEPVAYFGAMHDTNENSDGEQVVYCSMAHVVDDYDMPDLVEVESDVVTGNIPGDSADIESPTTGLPSRNWGWHPTYGVMHQDSCTECGLRAHHVDRGIREATASISHALNEPTRRALAEYQRGIGLGRRTRLAYVEGSEDALLPTAVRIMAEHLRTAEGHRVAAQHALQEARAHSDASMGRLGRHLDEAAHRLSEMQLLTGRVRVQTDTVRVSSPAGTLWVEEDGTVSIRHYPDEVEEFGHRHDWGDPIIMTELDEVGYLEDALATEPLGPSDPSGSGAPNSPRWRWSRLFGAVHAGNSCTECHDRAVHVTRHILDESANLEMVLRYPSQLARRRYDNGWDEGNRAQPQANRLDQQRMEGALRILAGHVTRYRSTMREISEDAAIRASGLLHRGGTPTEVQHCIDAFRRIDGAELLIEPRDILVYPDDVRVMTPLGPVMISRLGPAENPSITLASMHLSRIQDTPATTDRTYRYAMRTKDQSVEVGDRPKTPAAMRHCATLRIQLNGHAAFAMIDTGSTGNFVSPAFATVTKMETFPLQQQLTLQLGCVGSRSKISHGARATVMIGDLSTKLYVDIANIDRYDCILGMPFLREHGVLLDFGLNQLTLHGGHRVDLDDHTVDRRAVEHRAHIPRSAPRSD